MKTNCRMSVPFTMLILLAGLDLVWLRAGYGKAYQPGILGEQANRPPSPLNNTEEPAILHIQVTDSDSQDGIPCRITIADKQNRLAPVSVLPDQQLAARAGVIYTPNGQARIKLPPGKYTLYATRGFEYSLAKKELDLTNGSLCQVQLQIRREVPTPHLISCDTHVHTLTHSGHGDATIDERMLTIAGEGVELPIATDHNFLADYSEAARRMGVEDRFTPVIGAEVTTKKGHFNAFPFKIGSPVPNFRIEEWPQLMAAIRSAPGVRAVVLNHPRDLHSNFRPFDESIFNAVTGENRRGFEFSFDAIEVINSGALQSDFMRLYKDWFALLNFGYRVTAVGSSDSHDVGEYIVGQARTYIVCNSEDVARINVDEVLSNILKGRVFVSMGLLTEITVNDRFGVGDLATGIGKAIRVEAVVYGPSWINADRLELFANGIKIGERRIHSPAGAVEKARVSWVIPKPANDQHLVAIASGPGSTEPHWPIHAPYQPTSPTWNPRVIGSTNPIWIDADGDGSFTPARSYATALVRRFGTNPRRLLPALASYDQAIAAQVASLCQSAGRDLRRPDFVRSLKAARKSVQQGFTSFTTTLPIK